MNFLNINFHSNLIEYIFINSCHKYFDFLAKKHQKNIRVNIFSKQMSRFGLVMYNSLEPIITHSSKTFTGSTFIPKYRFHVNCNDMTHLNLNCF